MRNVLASVALLLFSPVLAASSEVPLSTVVRNPAPFEQRAPQMATDGTNFLVAWSDSRARDAKVPLYAARLGPDGKLLDASPIAIPTTGVDGEGIAPLVTWTGNVYLVFWNEYTSRLLSYVRIDRDGHVLDAHPRTISNVGSVFQGAMASVNGRTLLLFTDNWPDTVLFGQFLENDGTKEGKRIAFPHEGRSDWSPQLATNGTSFYAVWTRWTGTKTGVVGATVSLDGVVEPERVITPDVRAGLLLDSDGTNYLVAYASTDASSTITTEQLDAAGTTLARNTHGSLGTSGYDELSALAHYNGGYLLARRRANEVSALLLDRTGAQTGVLPLAVWPSYGMSLTFASNAHATVSAWTDGYEETITGSDIFTDVIDGQPERTLISGAAPRQTHVRVATNGSGYLSAWIEWRTSSELRVGRFTAAGVPLDGEGIVVTTDVEEPPAITFDGANYLLAWITGRRDDSSNRHCAVRLTRVSTLGQVLDGAGSVVTTVCAASVGLGSNGQESLLAWSGPEADVFGIVASELVVNAVRVRQDATFDPARVIPSDNLRALDFSIGWNAGTWLVAWTRYEDWEDCGLCNPPMPPEYNVSAARLNAEFTLLDTSPLALADTDFDRAPSVAANGNGFLVAWERRADSTLRAQLVPRLGPPSGELLIGTGREPSVAVRGSDTVIAFEDAGDLFTVTFGKEGRTPLAASTDSEHAVRLIGANGALAAVYLRVAGEPLYNYVDRGFLRLLNGTTRGRAVRK
jgi:hypothetical protein